MKIYTKTGDNGQTGLFNGSRVEKDDNRIEACGALDELSAMLGLLKAALPNNLSSIRGDLNTVQRFLIRIGGQVTIAGSEDYKTQNTAVIPAEIEQLESWIDTLSGQLIPIRNFVIPGDDPVSAQAHLARTACRLAERRMVTVYRSIQKKRDNQVMPWTLMYVNRLSDYLFILAEWIAQNVKNRSYRPLK